MWGALKGWEIWNRSWDPREAGRPVPSEPQRRFISETRSRRSGGLHRASWKRTKLLFTGPLTSVVMVFGSILPVFFLDVNTSPGSPNSLRCLCGVNHKCARTIRRDGGFLMNLGLDSHANHHRGFLRITSDMFPWKMVNSRMHVKTKSRKMFISSQIACDLSCI